MCQSALSNGSPRPARLRSNLGKDLSVGVARGAVFGLVLLGLTACGSASVTGAKEPGSSTTTTVGLSTRPTAPPTTTFSTVNVPTPQQQGIPTVALGTSQEVTKLTDTATITLLKVVDPVAPASSTSTVPASHTVGLDFSVENLTSDPSWEYRSDMSRLWSLSSTAPAALRTLDSAESLPPALRMRPPP